MTETVRKFRLNPDFLDKYKNIKPEWGPIGEFIFYRTYSRKKENGQQESWLDCCIRVVEGIYNTQVTWLATNKLLRKNWNWHQGQRSAQKMFELMFTFKFLPPGRGLWALGTEAIEKKFGAVANNCAFISTEKITVDFVRPFIFNADMSMLGVGVGFDTRGKDKVTIKEFPKTTDEPFIVKDTREGWLDLIETVLFSFIRRAELPLIRDYSRVRNEGEEIKTFGGTSSGPLPLEKLIQDIVSIFGFEMPCTMTFKEPEMRNIKIAEGFEITRYSEPSLPLTLTSVHIVDLMNAIGKCIVAGNVRRSSQIALGDPEDIDFINIKSIFKKSVSTNLEKVKDIAKRYPMPQYAVNTLVQRSEEENTMTELEFYKSFGPYSWRWSSNNSIFAKVGMDYSPFVDKLATTGEPGFFWLDNARNFGRMIDPPDYKDNRVKGCNPCGEQSLENSELCTLVETFINRCEDLTDFKRALKFAYLYAKTITLIPTHDEETNAVLLKNRRIGTSLAGVTSLIARIGYRETVNWLEEGYQYLTDLDNQYSDWLCVPRSKKKTSLKPGGTTPLLPGEVSGVNFPFAEYYIRRVRLSSSSPYVTMYKKAGYPVEADVTAPTNTMIISFPIHIKNFYKSEKDATIWEQLQIVSLVQRHWSDNQVSCSIKFKDHEIEDIKTALPMYETSLKAVTFAPSESMDYDQPPMEEIKKEEYEKLIKKLKPVNLQTAVHEIEDKFCDSDRCQIGKKE